MHQKHTNEPIKNKFVQVPIIGYFGRLIWYIISLPKQQASIRDDVIESKQELSHKIEEISNKIQPLVKSIHQVVSDQKKSHTQLSNRVADINHQLQLLSRTSPQPTKQVKSKDRNANLLADDHNLDKFYVDFENKFRGSEKDIEERLSVYLPYFKESGLNFKKQPVLDIGCGRGELLKVLGDSGISNIGLDINQSMVERANKHGYKAIQANAIEYLMGQKTNSFSAITGFHIAEHIPFNTLLRLFEDCYRVLVPGGFIIFETPNPESIHVGSYSFFYDPSHLHPIPPDMLAFTLENRGFDKVEILRLHPKRDGYDEQMAVSDEFTSEIIGRFFGPQDYAVIAYKSK